MARYLALALSLGLFTAVEAQSSSIVPLYQKRFEYDQLPYKVDTDSGERGTQYGYNLCNTTDSQTSKCQTALINDITDFCLWGPPDPNSVIGNTEGESVAWCTKPGRGTRLIPAGALTAVQFMRTEAYVQVVGLINQDLINIQKDDGGGEMDPHGADQRGNPLGGLFFSNAFASNGGNKNHFQQVIEWHNFMGSNTFCLKACDPAGPNAAKFCQHIYDRIGCNYNAPAAYKPDVFESCDGAVQDYPGVYTGADGVTSTYSQPPESLGPIETLPYTARIPASSNCVAATSAAIYTGLPTVSSRASSSTASSSSGASGSATQTGSTTARPTGSAASAAASSASTSATSTSNSASHISPLNLIGNMAGIAAVVFGMGAGLMIVL